MNFMNTDGNFKGNLYKAVFVALGVMSLGTGVAARFIPGIPTTPFVFLAMMCFNKSSKRLSSWLEGTVIYKKTIGGYVKHKAMTLKQKLSIQIFASLMMAVSFITVDNLTVRIILAVLFLAHHYVFIFRIKTYSPDDAPAKSKNGETQRFSRREVKKGHGGVQNQ